MAFNGSDIGVMGEAVKQGGDGGGVGEDGVPVFEGAVGGQQQGAALVAAVDDFIKQIGGIGIIGEITDFINLCGAPHKLIYVESSVMWS